MERRKLAHAMTTGFGVGTGERASRRAARLIIGTRGRRRGLRAGAVLAVLAALGLLLGLGISLGWVLPATRAAGRLLDFYGGVVALVSLSLTVMIGLVATDRAVLAPRHRVRVQAIHRALAFLALSMLLVHLASQLLRQRTGMVQAFMPGPSAYGLAALASYLLVVAVASGIARGHFALTGRPGVWRVLHLTAYVAWPMAIHHGLTAGRDPARWVTACYLLCLAGVVLALIARPLLRPRAKRRTA